MSLTLAKKGVCGRVIPDAPMNEMCAFLSRMYLSCVQCTYRCVLHYPSSYGRDNDNNFPISSAQIGESVLCLRGLFFPRFRGRSPRVARPSIMQGDPPVKSHVGKAGEEKRFLTVSPSYRETISESSTRKGEGRKLKSVFANVWRGWQQQLA